MYNPSLIWTCPTQMRIMNQCWQSNQPILTMFASEITHLVEKMPSPRCNAQNATEKASSAPKQQQYQLFQCQHCIRRQRPRPPIRRLVVNVPEDGEPTSIRNSKINRLSYKRSGNNWSSSSLNVRYPPIISNLEMKQFGSLPRVQCGRQYVR